MSILFGMVTSAVMRSRLAARRRKVSTDRITLAAAARAYYHQFGVWPVDNPDSMNLRVCSNNNYMVIDRLVSNELRRSFLNLGEYQFDKGSYVYGEQCNVITPWGERYTFIFNPRDIAQECPNPRIYIGADSMIVTNFGSP